MTKEADSRRRKTGFARLLEIAGDKRGALTAASILAVLHALLLLAPYMLIYRIIRELLVAVPDYSAVWGDIALAAAAAVLSYALLYASGVASHIAAFNILYGLRKALAVKLERLPIGFINRKSSGAIKKILSEDIERVEQFIAHQVPDFVKGVALPVITLAYLFVLDWRLALASVIPFAMVLIMIPIAFIRKDNKQLMQDYLDSQEEMNGVIVEYVRAMPVVKVFNQTVQAFARYRQSVTNFRDRVLYYLDKNTPPNAVMISFVSNNLLPVLAVGVWLYLDRSVELSVLLFFLILGVGYVKPLFALSSLGSQLYLVVKSVERMDEIMEAEETRTVGHPLQPADGSVRFHNVSFGYEERLKALDDVSLDIPEGSVTAFVGPSGAGKSTAAQLIARFWDTEEGQILIGGVDIRCIRPEELYRHVSFVFQDAFLFQDTVAANIRMGLDVSPERVEQAARATMCHEFISRLPHGYETRIGDSGVHFSGGETQRIMLARAMLRDAPIIVLDEATAYADPDNEAKIQQALAVLLRGKTVIVIAHRLSTITSCDQIVVFDNGRVEATGKHAELLQRSELYARMWQAHARAKDFVLKGVSG